MWRVVEPHDHRDDEIANGESQPSASDAEAALYLREFTEQAFTGAIWRNKTTLRWWITFCVSPSLQFHFTAKKNVPFHVFRLI